MTNQNRDNQNSQAKVTVEDLLRVKRAERPDKCFWADFERSFEQKRLQALQTAADAEADARTGWRLFTGLRLTLAGAAAVALFAGVVSVQIVHSPADSSSAGTLVAEADTADAVLELTLEEVAAEIIVSSSFQAAAPISSDTDYVIDTINLASASPVRRFERIMELDTFRKTGSAAAVYVADSLSASADAAFSTASYDFF